MSKLQEVDFDTFIVRKNYFKKSENYLVNKFLNQNNQSKKYNI